MIHTFNVSNGNMTGMIHNHTDAVNQIDISPNQQYLISVSDDKTIRVFDFSSGTELKVINDAVRGTQNTISIAPDNNHFVVGTGDGSVVLWRLDEVLSVNDLKYSNSKVIVTPNPTSNFIQINIENKLASKAQTSVKLYNVAGQEMIIIYDGITHEKLQLTQKVDQLANGQYYINVVQNGQLTTHSVIINK
jgi:WD40 repeat protein